MIKNGVSFAQACSQSTFDRVFQYKIMTQILPTNYYLKRYRIKDTDLCSKCDTERDTVLHNLWLCPVLVPYIEKIINFLKNECNVNEDITKWKIFKNNYDYFGPDLEIVC